MACYVWSAISNIFTIRDSPEVTVSPVTECTLGELLCGRPTGTQKADKTLQNLTSTINTFSGRGIQYLNEDFSDEAKYFGAFSARVVLENSCAALVGRFDPFRLLYLNEFQSQPNFEHGSPSKSGFRWQGDVMNPNKPIEQAKMWSGDNDLTKISRSLFSEHYDHLVWRPAYNDLLDSVSNSRLGDLDEITGIDADSFIPRMKGKFRNLYSSLSKGVHWDFFNSSIEYDESTLKTDLQDMFTQISILGLASHFVPTAHSSLNTAEALSIYIEIRSQLS